MRKSYMLLLALTSLLMYSGPASAAEFDDNRNWLTTEVAWSDSGRLSADHQLAAPLTACYNMAYGTPVLGINVMTPRGDYVAAITALSGGELRWLDSVEGLPAPVQWDAGKYFVAANVPDRELIVWFTAPAQNPYRLRLPIATEMFDCIAFPPPGIQSEPAPWRDWRIAVAHHIGSIDDYPGADTTKLSVAYLDGTGSAVEELPLVPLKYSPSVFQFLEYPIDGGSVPLLVGANRAGVHSAYYDTGSQTWIGQTLPYDAAALWGLYLDHSPYGPTAIIHYIEDSASGKYTVMGEIALREGRPGQILSGWGGSRWFEGTYGGSQRAFIRTTYSPYPFLVGADIGRLGLAYNPASSHTADDNLGYRSVVLVPGSRGLGAALPDVQSPIAAVAGSSHWRSGMPSLFWIQQDNTARGDTSLYVTTYSP